MRQRQSLTAMAGSNNFGDCVRVCAPAIFAIIDSGYYWASLSRDKHGKGKTTNERVKFEQREKNPFIVPRYRPTVCRYRPMTPRHAMDTNKIATKRIFMPDAAKISRFDQKTGVDKGKFVRNGYRGQERSALEPYRHRSRCIDVLMCVVI